MKQPSNQTSNTSGRAAIEHHYGAIKPTPTTTQDEAAFLLAGQQHNTNADAADQSANCDRSIFVAPPL
ncbi:hypothetical protein T4E_5479 [Trichinella pseudospiralis]|uniref:Uncharacterized protein n=1 Tax=Trichinella pseudospiralis TaxID=6337 RepID=A0A0V0Y765_TRIPS|nr:hypothetical protein T4E_5479 [Trichinella pseudospiralis]